MKLTDAKEIADHPSAYHPDLLREALARLEATRGNGRVRNSERAQERLNRRIARINDDLRERAARQADNQRLADRLNASGVFAPFTCVGAEK